MKRVLIVLAMIACSVFMATPVLAADGDPATETVAANEEQVDPEPPEDPIKQEEPNDVTPPAEPPPAEPPPAEAFPENTVAEDSPAVDPAPDPDAETPPAESPVAEKLSICHAGSSQSNPYQSNAPNASGDASGHLDHNGPVWSPGASDWGDIIPPFTFEGVEYSLNWNDAGQAIHKNKCSLLVTSDDDPSGDDPSGEVLDEQLDSTDDDVPSGEVLDEQLDSTDDDVPSGEVLDEQLDSTDDEDSSGDDSSGDVLDDHLDSTDDEDSSDEDSSDDELSDDESSDQPDRVDLVNAVLPDTGGVSRGWIPVSGLLMVAGTIVLARRRTI